MTNKLYSFVENELNLLLEQERDFMKTLTIEQLEERLVYGKTPQEFMNDCVREIMKPIYKFYNFSNSNFEYLLQTVYTLAHFQNLTPLSLDDSEFEKAPSVDNKIIYQNKRNPKVFKEIIYTHSDGEKSLAVACGKPVEECKQLQLDLD